VIVASYFLALYFTVASVYLAHIFTARIFGHYRRSQSWETIQALVALAMNLDAPPCFRKISAGIERGNNSMKRWRRFWRRFWRRNVVVRVVDDDRVQLMIGSLHEDNSVQPVADKIYT
jgi:hypothetical protein